MKLFPQNRKPPATFIPTFGIRKQKVLLASLHSPNSMCSGSTPQNPRIKCDRLCCRRGLPGQTSCLFLCRPLCLVPLCILIQQDKVPQEINHSPSFLQFYVKNISSSYTPYVSWGHGLSFLPLCLQQCPVLTQVCYFLISAENSSWNSPCFHPTSQRKENVLPLNAHSTEHNLRSPNASAYFLLCHLYIPLFH